MPAANTEKAPASPERYNPAAELLAIMVALDRPVDIHQLRKALPKMPHGTLSSTLTKLADYKVVSRNEGTRPALWRALVKALPKELSTGRTFQPFVPGQKRASGAHAHKVSKSDDVLVAVPIGRKQTLTCTDAEARALHARLGRLFGLGK